jgi:hypothetical protein
MFLLGQGLGTLKAGLSTPRGLHACLRLSVFRFRLFCDKIVVVVVVAAAAASAVVAAVVVVVVVTSYKT